MTTQLDGLGGIVVKDRVDAGGLDTYYEIHGTGEPLVYLHGGFNTIEMIGRNLPALAERHRVYLPDRQGQGRTPDREGPISYRSMAQDTIAFFDAIGLTGADVVGFSDGAMVAMLVALKRPDLVRGLVLVGCAANLDGVPPFYLELMQNFTTDNFPAEIRQMCQAVSADGPEHWPVIFEKARALFFEPGISLDSLAAVRSPTLVLIGDDDAVTPEHAAAMVRALPAGSQLGVVPGTSHGLPFEKPDLVNRLVLDFLDAEQVPKRIGTSPKH